MTEPDIQKEEVSGSERCRVAAMNAEVAISDAEKASDGAKRRYADMPMRGGRKGLYRRIVGEWTGKVRSDGEIGEGYERIGISRKRWRRTVTGRREKSDNVTKEEK